jgi:hypothetical protein
MWKVDPRRRFLMTPWPPSSDFPNTFSSLVSKEKTWRNRLRFVPFPLSFFFAFNPILLVFLRAGIYDTISFHPCRISIEAMDKTSRLNYVLHSSTFTRSNHSGRPPSKSPRLPAMASPTIDVSCFSKRYLATWITCTSARFQTCRCF